MGQLTDYKFKTEQFGLTEKGVHFLRKGYNYQTVDYSQINYAEIRKGKELKNWFIIFLLGTLMVIAGVFITIPIVEAFQKGDMSGRQVRIVLLLFIPVVGGYFVYSSLQTGTILKINYGSDKKSRFSLNTVLINNEMTDFKIFLAGKLKGKLKQ